MTFVNNIKAAFDSSADEKTRDSGELVSTIIMIAGFAIMSLLAVNWLSTSVLNKAADVSACIEGANTSSTAAASASQLACKNGDTTLKSYTADAGYIGRK